MTIDCIRAADLKIAGVVINSYNAVESMTADEMSEQVITQYSGVEILSVVPFDETVSIEEPNLGEFVIGSLMDCDWARLAGQ